ncbi:unnamed protein product [Chrysodeixis includens]|uniref:Ig-like domain-containing protein n=1 Tax=Chrysodeixis includens TaxID=689277 RepID=A0A9N8Q0P5_CHRIL|nr:unnamed protein product [Chrysodeixis includens]
MSGPISATAASVTMTPASYAGDIVVHKRVRKPRNICSPAYRPTLQWPVRKAFNRLGTQIDFKTGDKKVITGPFWREVFTETYEDHEEDLSTTTSEPLPFFEDDASTNNVTAQLESRVHLHCRVHDLGEKTISWVRRRGDELHLLSFGRHTYSADSRYSLAFEHPNDWRLLIQYVSERDEGFYECQISTHPPLVRRVHLTVVEAEQSCYCVNVVKI